MIKCGNTMTRAVSAIARVMLCVLLLGALGAMSPDMAHAQSKKKKTTSRKATTSSKSSAKAGPCTRPDTTDSWFKAQRSWQNYDATHRWSNDSLRIALIEGARAASIGMASHGSVEIGASLISDNPPFIRNVDTAQVNAIREHLYVLSAKGAWPIRSQVGAAGAHAAAVLAMGDTILSKAAIARLKKSGAKEVPVEDIAVLEDMLRMKRGSKQLYSTQMTMKRDRKGVMHVDPAPTTEKSKVDTRRRAANLPKLSQALCAVRAMVPGAAGVK